MGVDIYRRLDTARGEQGEHVPGLNPEVFGKTADELPEGNPAAGTPVHNKPNAEQHLVVEEPVEEAAPEATSQVEEAPP